ncbi:LmeA family phospholipid-binding protein [Streptomyces sp. NPDC058424]|uniref:LmeA family phospholipid-binding protein n=1 Tax=Streptomyces sp. NPDC058424 TaxID=3346491 RepID=UPI0036603F7B
MTDVEAGADGDAPDQPSAHDDEAGPGAGSDTDAGADTRDDTEAGPAAEADAKTEAKAAIATDDTGGTDTAAPTPEDGEYGKDGRKDGPRAGRKPRRIVRRTVKTPAVLVVVLAFLALGDRWAVLYAQDLAAQQVQKALGLHAAPEVHIDSFPFLGQVLAGGVDHVEVSVPHVDAGPVSVAQVRANVDDIRIVGSLPSSVKGVVLGRVRGDILLDFKDLNREVGGSQVHLSPGPGKKTVLARGDLPVGGRQAQVRGWAQLRRVGDRGLAMSVRDVRVVVPGLLTYVPGKGGGLQLTAAAADRMDEDKLQQAAGKDVRPQQKMKGRVLDALVHHPSVLKPTGIDPSLIQGLQKLQEPKVAQQMEFSAQLPDDLPGDIRLRDISVAKDGIRAQLTGKDVRLSR